MHLANQTQEHNELCLLVPKWVNARCTGRGMRYAHEVFLGPGYVADAVAIASFQYRHEMAYTSGEKVWNRKEAMGPWVCVFEAKASRSDFLATFRDSARGRHQPVGSLHWVVTPRGLIRPEELPPFWGLLEKRGAGLAEIHTPQLQPITLERLHAVGYEILFKRERGYYAGWARG